MKRRFVLAFVALFVLFAIGIVTSLVFIWRGSNELRAVLASHQVEELRQALSRSLQRSQQDLQVSGTVFANQLDDIIANVEDLDRSVQSCFGCHHEPALRREMERVADLVEVYKHQYSTFITAFLNPERRQELQLEAAATADEIDGLVESMLRVASPALKRRTLAATAKVERSWTILVSTLALTFFGAIAISFMLTRSVTEPVDRLVKAVERIRNGELGHRIEHHEPRELGVLMEAFNDMSATLESKTRRIEDYVERLHRLNESVVSLYAEPGGENFYARQVQAIDGLIGVEFRGCIVKTGLKDVYLVSLSPRGETTPKYRTVISAARLESIREGGDRLLLAVREGELDGWPFGAWASARELRNYLVSWVEWQGQFQGALLAVNKISGEIEAEDGELLIALGQALSPALQFAGDSKSLQEGMDLPQSLEDYDPTTA